MKTRVMLTLLAALAARQNLSAADEPAPPPATIKVNDLRYLDDASAWRKNPADDCANTLKDIPLADGVAATVVEDKHLAATPERR